ncbi:MAG: hypothetical protein SO039_03810, partial [Campylobacter sp.]|nr:hypothetical protein [Campylobacter sp.]
ASLTNGKISDNSPGVKVLSLDEAKQVKGGYYFINTGLVTRDTIRTYYYYEVRNDNGSTVNSDFGYGSNVIIAVQLGVPLNKRIGTPRYDVVALNQYGQKIASGFWNGAANRILRAAGAF